MRSITSLMSLGARMRLANMDLSLREPCPKRAQRGSEGRITVRGPEGHEVLGLTVGHAPQLDRRRRLGRYPVRLEEGREIGRASCRERVWIAEVGVAIRR